jgi:glycosyltransferase involved in cell wall biosynthesis
MRKPRISIIIPCYNQGQYIDEAIKNVEESDSGICEIIIINDGSTDEFTNKRLNELRTNGYHVIFQENQGLCKSRNNGIKLSKGEYILPLDADNIITSDLITLSIEVLDTNNEISIVYSDRQNFGESNDLIQVGEFDLPRILRGNYIDACAVYRKTIWEEIGGYDERMPAQGLEDWEFWISAAERNFKFHYIPKALFYYRFLGNSMARTMDKNPKFNSLLEYIYKKHSLIMTEKFINEIFELKEEVNQLQLELIKSRKSKPYRLGKFLLRPFYLIKGAKDNR